MKHTISGFFAILTVLAFMGCSSPSGDKPKSDAKAITEWILADPAAIGMIDEALKTIAITVPYGTDVSALVPTIVQSGVSVSPASGIAQNFSDSVDYTVTAEDGSKAVYAVTVTVAANSAKTMTGFSFVSPSTTGTIDEDAGTVNVIVPYGTDVLALVPTIAHTGASVSPASGGAQSFAGSVDYTVTADDGSKAVYAVTVTVAPIPVPAMPTAPAVATDPTRIILNWTAVTYAASYEVWYGTSSSYISATQAAGNVTATTYIIEGLSGGTTYYVWLKATNASGTSGFGSRVTAITAPPADVVLPMVSVTAKTFPTGTYDTGTATVAKNYWIGETEVTYELWYTVKTWALANGYTFANPGREGHDGTIGATMTAKRQHPVTEIDLRDSKVFCNALTEWSNAKKATSYTCVYTYGGTIVRNASLSTTYSAVSDAAATGFRLLSRNEYELAARWRNDSTNTVAGYSSPWFTKGNSSSGATTSVATAAETMLYAICYDNSDNTTATVKTKLPNALGLYDMSGNVWEFIAEAGTLSTNTVCGGGSLDNSAMGTDLMIGSFRSGMYIPANTVGFRVARND